MTAPMARILVLVGDMVLNLNPNLHMVVMFLNLNLKVPFKLDFT